ncbi:MAG TPA: hypothetical protein VI078_01725 [bacterium]
MREHYVIADAGIGGLAVAHRRAACAGTPPRFFAAFRIRRPIARIGYSIFLYRTDQ